MCGVLVAGFIFQMTFHSCRATVLLQSSCRWCVYQRQPPSSVVTVPVKHDAGEGGRVDGVCVCRTATLLSLQLGGGAGGEEEEAVGV